MKAVDLLTAFSGESAQQFAPFFSSSDQTSIVGVEIHAVGNERTTARYSGREKARKEVNNILRIRTSDGYEGVSGVDSFCTEGFDEKHFRELQSIVSELVALRSQDPVEARDMFEQTHPGLSDAVCSSVDIALWDLAAHRAGRPLFELLGAARDSVEPYASLPFYESLSEHIEAVNQLARLGFTNFKFHVWGMIDQDIRLVEFLQKNFADSQYRFMIDVEEKYGLEDALRLGARMDEGLFVWLEGPLADERLADYAELKRRLGIQIVPDGCRQYSAAFIKQGIEAESWGAGRFDVTAVGGVSTALELLMMANSSDLAIEIQSWGHSLAQAANLHLVIANERSRYFEMSTPKDAFEFGMKNGNLLNRGRAVAPEEPGLGIRVDWDQLPYADFHECAKFGSFA